MKWGSERALARTKPAAVPPWTVILAAEEGRSLLPLTRALHGEELPKQFAYILEAETSLQATVTRALRWSPPERIVVLVAEEHEDRARSQLEGYGPLQVTVQPRQRGTGPGFLLAVEHVLAVDPDAYVVVTPSDHYVQDDLPLVEAVVDSVEVARSENAVVLIGAPAERVEPDYGWIVCERRAGAASMAVTRFVERPSAYDAESLLYAGALRNTSIMAGAARSFWELCSVHLPDHCTDLQAFRKATRASLQRPLMASLYARMAYADLGRDVLENATDLRVVSLGPCGWSDWGTLQRVLASLRNEDVTRLLDRLRGGGSARARMH